MGNLATLRGLGTFTHVLAYSEMLGKCSGIFRVLCNPGIFRALVYSKSGTEAYSELFQTSMMEHVAKIVSSCSFFHK